MGRRQRTGREGETISSLGKQHPLLMSGSAVIESPALSLTEHLSGLAHACVGESRHFITRIQWRCADLDFLTIMRRSQSVEWHPGVSFTMFKTSYTVSLSLLAYVALCDQEKPEVPYRRSQSTRGGALLDVSLGWTTLAAEMMRQDTSPLLARLGMRMNSTGCWWTIFQEPSLHLATSKGTSSN